MTERAIDDVHWVDEQSLDFLTYLLSRPPSGLAVILTFRDEQLPSGVRGLTGQLAPSVGQTHTVLGPLDRAHCGALAAAVLDVEQVSDEFATYLHERTAGLPFAIQELLALLHTSGSLSRRGGGWARKTLEDLDVPAGIRDQVLDHLSRLPPDAQAVVEAAAVLELPASVQTLLGTCELPEERARSGLGKALTSGLLSEPGGLIGFRHLLAAQAVYEHLSLHRRQQLHRRAAEALRRVPQPARGQLAHHLRRSGDLEAWSAAAQDAADQAIGLRHDDEAARLLADVLRDAPLTADQRAQIAVRLGTPPSRR